MSQSTERRGVPGRTLPLLARGRWVLAFLLWLLFVVYGSLVPLEWRAVPWEQAVAQFRALPWLDLGAVSRADWVANIVLYVPLGFLGCAALWGFRAPAWLAWPGALLVLAGCLGVAVVVEFTQVFFAPRTVSLNDLLAEAIGAILGVSLWLFGRWQVLWMADSFARGGRPSISAALVVLALAYVLLSLFPFDFVVSLAELRERLARGADGWLFGACESWLRCLATALVEFAAIAPLGLLMVLRVPRVRLRTLLLLGLGIGLALELGQLLIFSGNSRGLSVLLRGGGLVAGGALGRYLLTRLEPAALAAWLLPWVPLLALPWALAAMGLSGWFVGDWLAPAAALARLPDLGWVPFYYHYWTSEPVAMASLLAQLALYLPIGLGFWMRTAATGRPGVWPVLVVTVLAAVVIEAGKLFFTGARPDPSNLIIAPAGALAGFWGALWFARALGEQRTAVLAGPAQRSPQPSVATAALIDRDSGAADGRGQRPIRATVREADPGPDHAPAPRSDNRPEERSDDPSRGGLRLFLRSLPSLPRPRLPLATPAAVPFAVALVGLVLYPVAALWLGLALALYGAALWFRPWLVLLVLPAALPALDASPVTGRLLLDEFDLLVLVSVAVLGARLSGVRPARWPVPLLPVAVLLLWLTWLLGTGLGLGGSDGLFAAPRAASHTPLAAWHVGKGLLWALLLIGPLRRLRRAYGSAATSRLLLDGVVLGLAWTTLVVLWERHIHVGLWDFDDVFRVTGPFASMYAGGAYIEAFLAFAFPVLLVWMVRRTGWWSRLPGALLVPLAGYAMLVTFSRAGYGALLVVVLVLVGGLLIGPRRVAGWRAWTLPAVLVALLAMLAVPALTTGFAQQRLAQAEQDLRFRLTHWSGALAMMDDTLSSLLLGEGFGRYPLAYVMAGRGQPGTFLVQQEAGQYFVRLGAGESVFLDQWVPVRADTPYRLSARLRALEDTSFALTAPLCHKALLYSFACAPATLAGQSEDGYWVAVSTEINSGAVGRGGNWPHGPVKLALHNAGKVALDVDDVALIDPQGRDLIANGGFGGGAERWLFVTDQDLAWHIHQQWVEMFFAQGLLGLLAFVLLLFATLQVLWPAIRAGRLEGLALAAGLAGFLAVGLLGSTMDAARPMLLCYFGAFSAALLVRGAPKRSRRG